MIYLTFSEYYSLFSILNNIIHFMTSNTTILNDNIDIDHIYLISNKLYSIDIFSILIRCNGRMYYNIISYPYFINDLRVKEDSLTFHISYGNNEKDYNCIKDLLDYIDKKYIILPYINKLYEKEREIYYDINLIYNIDNNKKRKYNN